MTDSLGFQHRYIPVSGAKRTLLMLHGTGGDENDLISLGQFLDKGANILSPLGKVREGRSARFFRRLAEGVFDLEDLKLRTAELIKFIDDAAEHYGFGRDFVVAAGFSNGANIAASIVLTDPSALAGAILFAPMLPFTPPPDRELGKVPVFMSAGRFDQVIPPRDAQALEDALRAHGAEVTAKWHDGGHVLDEASVIAARGWLSSLAM